LSYTGSLQRYTGTTGAAQQITPQEKQAVGTNLLWIVGGLSVLGAGLVLWSWRYNLKRTGHITRGARSNPGRPPEGWMHD
jgi:hypothetical protein